MGTNFWTLIIARAAPPSTCKIAPTMKIKSVGRTRMVHVWKENSQNTQNSSNNISSNVFANDRLRAFRIGMRCSRFGMGNGAACRHVCGFDQSPVAVRMPRTISRNDNQPIQRCSRILLFVHCLLDDEPTTNHKNKTYRSESQLRFFFLLWFLPRQNGLMPCVVQCKYFSTTLHVNKRKLTRNSQASVYSVVE